MTTSISIFFIFVFLGKILETLPDVNGAEQPLNVHIFQFQYYFVHVFTVSLIHVEVQETLFWTDALHQHLFLDFSRIFENKFDEFYFKNQFKNLIKMFFVVFKFLFIVLVVFKILNNFTSLLQSLILGFHTGLMKQNIKVNIFVFRILQKFLWQNYMKVKNKSYSSKEMYIFIIYGIPIGGIILGQNEVNECHSLILMFPSADDN